MKKDNTINKPFKIDLSGPTGNAFYLIGFARNNAKNILGYNYEETENMITEMKKGNYEHLTKTFKKHFGEKVILHR